MFIPQSIKDCKPQRKNIDTNFSNYVSYIVDLSFCGVWINPGRKFNNPEPQCWITGITRQKEYPQANYYWTSNALYSIAYACGYKISLAENIGPTCVWPWVVDEVFFVSPDRKIDRSNNEDYHWDDDSVDF